MSYHKRHTILVVAIFSALTFFRLNFVYSPQNGLEEQLQQNNQQQDHAVLEQWLKIRDGSIACNFEPKGVPEDQWFYNISPDLMPNFSLVGAWLKSEAPSAQNAPRDIPPMYESDFTMGGQVQLWNGSYWNQGYLGGNARTNMWTIEIVQKNMEMAKNRKPMKYRRDGLKIHDGIIKYKSHIEGKRGIVIGSEDPWVEAILLEHGAGKLLTVEFGKIVCEHPQIDTVVPAKFTESFLNREIEQFDFGISFSSLEHDGLGRYGDVLNPLGDLQSMAKMLSVVKPGGLFFVAVPSAVGIDALQFNAHRVYGDHRLPKLFAGWKFIDVIGKDGGKSESRKFSQHLWILQNTNGCSNTLNITH